MQPWAGTGLLLLAPAKATNAITVTKVTATMPTATLISLELSL